MDPDYHPLSRLTGPRDAVLSLAFSAKAKFLSASGYSGVFIWDLSTSIAVTKHLPHMLFAPQNPKYVITASTWIYFQKTKRHVLILGSMRGDILLWDWTEQRKTFNLLYRVSPMNDSSDEILSIDIHEQDVASGRIGRVVTSSANRFISVWTLTSSGEFSKVFTTTLDDNLKPKTVCMCKQTRDIFVFPLYGGEIIRLDYKTGEIKSRKSPGPGRMGSVALNRTSDKFVAYTRKNFQLYRLGNLEMLKTFNAETPVVFYPKQVVFGESESIVVGGTDRGCALVYDVESERIIQTLQYPGGNLVQPVSTFTLPGRHLIAVAGSTQEQSSDVILYEKRFPQAATQASSEVDPEPNELIDPSAHSDHSVLIGFYVPKKVWNWVWITTSLLCLCLALYLAIPDSLARV
ncbi:WD40-repeat-containing domain protein [Lentinula raphanica]|nr:WD40-repeat-containing domain protein [Lentinula raphanica]